jgi:hypothetical protein
MNKGDSSELFTPLINVCDRRYHSDKLHKSDSPRHKQCNIISAQTDTLHESRAIV